MYIWTMQYELHDLGDSVYELKVLMFALKKTLHTIKMNNKIHANNVQSHSLKFRMILNSKFKNPWQVKRETIEEKKKFYTLYL